MKIDEVIEIVDKIKKFKRAKNDFTGDLKQLQAKIKRIVENESTIHIEIVYKNSEDSVRWDSTHYDSSQPGTRVYMAILADLQLEAEQLCEKIKECDEEIEKLSKLIEDNHE